MDLPLLWKVEEFPLTAALAAAVVVAVGLFPALFGLGRIPDHLGIGAYQEVASPAFQLLALGAVYYFIIIPVFCNPHSCSTFLRLFLACEL